MRESGLCTCLGRAEMGARARVCAHVRTCERARARNKNSAIDRAIRHPPSGTGHAYHGSREAHFQGEPRVRAITSDDSRIMHRRRKAPDACHNLVTVGEAVDVDGQPPRRHAAQHHPRLRTRARICRRQSLRQTPYRRPKP